MSSTSYGYFAGQQQQQRQEESRGYQANQAASNDGHAGQMNGSWQDPRSRTLDPPFSQQPARSTDQGRQGYSYQGQSQSHYGGMNGNSSSTSNGYGHTSSQPWQAQSGYRQDGSQGQHDYNGSYPYASPSQGPSPASTSYNHAVGPSSPTLPALNTLTPNSGFGDLYQQLEAQMDEIQAKHSPLSSPITPTQNSSATTSSTTNSGSTLRSSSALRPQYRTDGQHDGANDTARGSSYGGAGIISMYSSRTPSPSPQLASDMAAFTNPQQPAQPGQSTYSPYQTPQQDGRGHALTTLAQAQSTSTNQYSYLPALQTAPTTLSTQRQPVTTPYIPRTRTTSANTVATVSSTNNQRYIRPLPQSPATSYHVSSSSQGSNITASSATSRPSQDSNASSSYGYFSQNGDGSGIAAPRPSMSSSYSGKSSYGPREVRPLPVPSEEEESYSSSPADISGMSAYETASNVSSSRSQDSDFAKEFYAAGGTVPNELKQHPSSARKPRKKASQATSVTPSSSAGSNLPTSISYPEAIQRQAPAAQSSRPSTAGTSDTSRSGSQRTGYTGHTFGTAAADQRSYTSSASSNNSNFASPTSSPRLAQHPIPPPSIVHSYSDPVGNGRGPVSTPSRHRPLDAVSSSGNRSPQSSVPTASTSRSASFSISSSSTATERGKQRAPSVQSQPSIRYPRPSLPDLPPSLPSSPSISISPSFNDASVYSSQRSDYSSAQSQRTHSMRKQASLSPSAYSLSANGYLGSMRRDAEAEKHKLERMGLLHLNPALLSNVANAVFDKVPRTTNNKSAVPYPGSFTGDQLATTLAEMLPFPYSYDRRIAISVARTLHQNMFIHEVDWDDGQVRDSADQVFCFEDDEEQSTFDYLNTSASTSAGPNRMPNRTGRAQDELPTGVLTRFSKCYSPFCGMEGTSNSGACYSLYCPNGAHPLGLKRKPSSISLAQSAEEAAPAEAWASTASAELIEQLGPKEVARQNVIFEIVTGEQAYKKDLDMLETAFHEPLTTADPPVVYPTRLVEFSNQVFANLDELRNHSSRLIDALIERQREQNPVVQAIGDILLDAALEWGQAYVDYTEAQVMGEYLVNEEKTKNSSFSTFLASRREAFGIKQDFRHYHLRPTIRLQRYLLPLAEYVKRTPEDHPDRENVQEAMRIIREQCAACDTAVNAAQLKLACIKYDKLIEKDGNYTNDLNLQDPTRELFQHGKMFAKPEGTLAEWTEYQVMVFDNYLCIAKPRRTVEGYRLIQKPLRLEMVNLSGWELPPQLRSSGFHLRSVISSSDRREASTNAAQPDSKMWPIQFQIGGRTGGTLTLYVDSPKMEKEDKVRQTWRVKMEQAIAVRKAALDANKVFQLRLLVDPDLRKASPTNAPHPLLGEVLSSCPFTGPSGQPLIAIGTRNGLFIAVRHDPSTLRQILQITTTACAVLQDFGMFLVQTEGRLLSYLLETLVQSSSAGEMKGQQGPQQVSGQRDITFFKVGKVGERTLVVYAKRDGVNSTVLKAMEPVANIERSRIQHSRFLGMGGKKTEWFRLFKDGGVPTAVYNLSFTRSKLALVCAPGFEILDIETLKTGSFPDWTAIRADASKFDGRMVTLQRRCSVSRAIALFRISDSEFLFCYDTFAFFADRHGDPLPDRLNDLIEWEGRPDTVVFHRPYILAFDTRFVEVRDTSQRGKLVQFINGANIRCSYDGQGVPSSEIDVRIGGGPGDPEERKPHIVMREGKHDKIYEIVPCIA